MIYINLLFYYFIIYLCSIPFLFILFWFWLTYTNRVQLRIKAKNFGLLIRDKIKNNLSENNAKLIKKYCYNQINAFGEIIAGLSDGLLNNEPIIDIKYLKDADSQTTNIITQSNNETQTISQIFVNVETNTENITEKKEENKPIKHNIYHDLQGNESSEYIPPQKIFNIGKKTRLDTEVLEKDFKEDQFVKPKNKRIMIVKRK